MTEVNDTVAGTTQDCHTLTLNGWIMLGQIIGRCPVQFDMYTLASDMVDEDEIHGFLAAGLDAGVQGKTGPTDTHSAILDVAL